MILILSYQIVNGKRVEVKDYNREATLEQLDEIRNELKRLHGCDEVYLKYREDKP